MRRFLAIESREENVVADLIAEQNKQLPEGYTLRLLTLDDIVALLILREQLSKESDYTNASNRNREEHNVAQLVLPDALYLTIVHADRLVGLGVIYKHVGEDKIEAIHIALLAVLKEHAGNGLATSMINLGFAWGKAAHCKKVTISVDDKNTRARSLYAHLKFKEKETVIYHELEYKL